MIEGNSKAGTFRGRAVELREVSVGVALQANNQGSGLMSALYVLAHSAHWTDTGERVFASVQNMLDDFPMSSLPEINALAVQAGELNLGAEAMARATARPNGAAEGAGPSP
jgi:hypothetical protein